MDWRGLYNPNLSLGFAWTLFQHRRRRHYNKGKKQNSAKTIRNVKTHGSCGLPSVYLWNTVSIPMLHCRCKGAAPLVQGGCTSLVPLFSFDLDCVLTGQSEWRMKNEEWRMNNEEWRMNNEEWRMNNEEWIMKSCRLRRLRNKVRRPEGKPIIGLRNNVRRQTEKPL